MQSIDHKGLYAKCDNMGLLWTINFSYINLDNLDFKGWFLFVRNFIYIGSAIMIQENNLLKLISLLALFIELDKILLSIHVILVIDCTVIKSVTIHMICIGLKVFCIFSMRLLLCSIWVLVFLLLHFYIQVAWAQWMILVNCVVLWLSSFW